MHNGQTRWACYFPQEENESELDETDDLIIVTNPKQHGKIIRYFATIKHNNYLYYITSDSSDNTTSLFRCNSPEDVLYFDSQRAKGTIPKFYNLKLKEPLAPQFEKIFANLKMLVTFL